MSTIPQEITRLQNAKAALKGSIEAKGVTVASDATLDQYPALVDEIPQGGGGEATEKDVNFYDYEGTRLYSYTKQEFLALSALPDNPDRTSDGLTAQGWNWSLSDAKQFVSLYGFLNIGQTYITTDNATHFVVNVSEVFLNFYIYMGCSAANVASIDWGDGSSTTINNTSNTQYNHTYSTPGVYTIKLLSGGATLKLRSDSFKRSGYSDLRGCFSKVYFGVNVEFQWGAPTQEMAALEEVTIPLNLTDYSGYGCFTNCYNLKGLVVPNGATALPNSFANYCGLLRSVILPNGITNVGSFVSDNYSLHDLILSGNNLTSIDSYIFDAKHCVERIIVTGFNGAYTNGVYNCHSLRTLFVEGNFTKFYYVSYAPLLKTIILKSQNITDMTAVAQSCNSIEELYVYTATPPTIGVNAFSSSNIPKIYVPASAVDAYKAAENWSTYADKIFAIPE